MSFTELTVLDVEKSPFWQEFEYLRNSFLGVNAINLRAEALPAGATPESMGVPFPIAHVNFYGHRIYSQYGPENVTKLVKDLGSRTEPFLEILASAKVVSAASIFLNYLGSPSEAIVASAARNCHYLAGVLAHRASFSESLLKKFSKIRWSKNTDPDLVDGIGGALVAFADENIVKVINKKWAGLPESMMTRLLSAVVSQEDLPSFWAPFGRRLQDWVLDRVELTDSLEPETLKNLCHFLTKIEPNENLPLVSQIVCQAAAKKDLPRFIAALSAIKSLRQRMPILRETIYWLLAESKEVNQILLEAAIG